VLGRAFIAGLGDSSVVITWHNDTQDGDSEGIHGQRLVPTCGNGVVELWETCDPPNGGNCLPICQTMG
jgi:hypothetical protein